MLRYYGRLHRGGLAVHAASITRTVCPGGGNQYSSQALEASAPSRERPVNRVMGGIGACLDWLRPVAF
jgi:hypothetical protein